MLQILDDHGRHYSGSALKMTQTMSALLRTPWLHFDCAFTGPELNNCWNLDRRVQVPCAYSIIISRLVGEGYTAVLNCVVLRSKRSSKY